jgi:predicted anti-sigma-YlaC factor YlaD
MLTTRPLGQTCADVASAAIVLVMRDVRPTARAGMTCSYQLMVELRSEDGVGDTHVGAHVWADGWLISSRAAKRKLFLWLAV